MNEDIMGKKNDEIDEMMKSYYTYILPPRKHILTLYNYHQSSKNYLSGVPFVSESNTAILLTLYRRRNI